MTRFLIFGANIAGPALAYWLLKAGYDVTLVERAPAPQRSFWAIHDPTRAANPAEMTAWLEKHPQN